MQQRSASESLPGPTLGRVVVDAATQSVRAMITGMIPITLIALFGWASAGSGSGNTGDAIRGAGLLWLGAHHVGMSLSLNVADQGSSGLFSLLPIGLLIIPVMTLRGAGLRLARALDGARLELLLIASLALAFSYGVAVTAVALLADTASVHPRFLEAFAYGFALALLAGGSRLLRVSWPTRWKRVLVFLRVAFGILLLGATALVVVSLLANSDEALNILSVLRLGMLSTLFVVTISLLYLPNLAIWALAYASGIGFAFGVDSLISPWSTSIASVPAFPLLAALPAQAPSWAPFLPLVVLVAMVAAAVVSHRGSAAIVRDGVRLVIVVSVLAAAMAWFSGGSLVGGDLAVVGPSIWKFPLTLSLYAAVGYFIGVGIPTWIRRRRHAINA